MSNLVKNIERVTGDVGILTSFLLIPLILATTYEVISRYAFEAPTVWAYEVGYVITGSHFLLGMAYTLQKGQFIRIDIFSQSMSAKTRAVIDLVGYSVVLPLMIWISYGLLSHLINGFFCPKRNNSN